MVLKFDLSSLPPNRHIDSAYLSLYCHKDSIPTEGTTVSIFKLLQDWKEDNVTWLHTGMTPNEEWSEPGGSFDYDSLIYEYEYPAEVDGSRKWEHFPVTKAIRDFYTAPGKNYGLLFNFGFSDQHEYYSAQYMTDSTLRPMLTIRFSETGIHEKPAKKKVNGGIKLKIIKNSYNIEMAERDRYSVMIAAINGKIIGTNAVYGTSYRIDGSTLPAGLYCITVKRNQSAVYFKVLHCIK